MLAIGIAAQTAWSNAVLSSAAPPGAATAYALVATLMTLGALEHLFLILPLPARAHA